MTLKTPITTNQTIKQSQYNWGNATKGHVACQENFGDLSPRFHCLKMRLNFMQLRHGRSNDFDGQARSSIKRPGIFLNASTRAMSACTQACSSARSQGFAR